MKRKSDKYLCECGHNRLSHYIESEDYGGFAGDRDSYCGPCRFSGILNAGHKFKLDNLRYLEMKSEQKDAS